MRDIFLAALVVIALVVIIYCWAVLIAHVTDRWEKKVIPSRQRSSIVPATTAMIDTDGHESFSDDVQPQTITQLVATVEAEERAAREAARAAL